jgi:hypothetical protein
LVLPFSIDTTLFGILAWTMPQGHIPYEAPSHSV